MYGKWNPTPIRKEYKNNDFEIWKEQIETQERADILMAQRLQIQGTPPQARLGQHFEDSYIRSYSPDAEDLSLALAKKLQEEEDREYCIRKSANDVPLNNNVVLHIVEEPKQETKQRRHKFTNIFNRKSKK